MSPVTLLLFFAGLLAAYTLLVVGLSWSAERQRRRAPAPESEKEPTAPTELHPADLEAYWREAVAWLEARPRARLALEWAVIFAVCIVLTRGVLDFDPQRRPAGADHERLSGLIIPAQIGLGQHGRAPAWNFYAGAGEPLFNNPFNYLFNPLASVPALLLGAAQGTKVAIFLAVLVAGLGAWVLAHGMGLGAPARVTAALFYMCSGGVGAKFAAGQFQLGVSLAWPPLVLAGVWLSLATEKRWPRALAAVALALLMCSGSLHYALPTLACAAILVLVRAVRVHWEARRVDVDWGPVRRALIAVAFGLALSAVQSLPLLAVREHILYPAASAAPDRYGLDVALTHYFLDPDVWAQLHGASLGADYAYVGLVPFALVALLIAPARRRRWGAWLAAAAAFAAMLVWGAGLVEPVQYLYAHEPLLAQYPDVGGAHTLGALWVGVLAALALDDAWDYLRRVNPQRRVWLAGLLVIAVGVGVVDALAVSGGFYAAEPTQERVRWWLEDARAAIEAQAHAPAYVYLADDIGAYLPYELQMKRWRSGEGWTPVPVRDEAARNLNFAPPYAIVWGDAPTDAAFVAEAGYRRVEDYRVWGRTLSLYAQPAPLPYAFAASETALAALGPDDLLTGDEVARAEVLAREIDALALWVFVPVEMIDPLFVVLETNFPGWSATVDGLIDMNAMGVSRPRCGAAGRSRWTAGA